MKGKTIALLENRVRDQLGDLVRKYGGRPFSAPALAEVSDIDTAYISRLLEDWVAKPAKVVIFQTGVTKALFETTDALGFWNAPAAVVRITGCGTRPEAYGGVVLPRRSHRSQR